MGKNSQLHLFLETETLNNLKKKASENNISVSELCRQKISQNSKIDRIEFMIEKILRKIENEN